MVIACALPLSSFASCRCGRLPGRVAYSRSQLQHESRKQERLVIWIYNHLTDWATFEFDFEKEFKIFMPKRRVGTIPPFIANIFFPSIWRRLRIGLELCPILNGPNDYLRFAENETQYGIWIDQVALFELSTTISSDIRLAVALDRSQLDTRLKRRSHRLKCIGFVGVMASISSCTKTTTLLAEPSNSFLFHDA